MARLRLSFGIPLAIAMTLALSAATLPDPGRDETDRAPSARTAVLAGGCFWGMEAVYDHVKGVTDVVSGYSGGDQKTARTELVESGRTDHAEAVKITYDPSKITYGQILKIFFAVAHDPTEWNRQGPDVGPQYRSVIFYADDEQKQVAESYIAQLTAAKVFDGKIVTELEPLTGFYPAEDFLQHYSERHPDSSYVIHNDLPKLKALKKQFPEFYRRRSK